MPKRLRKRAPSAREKQDVYEQTNYLYCGLLPGNRKDLPKINKALMLLGVQADIASTYRDKADNVVQPLFGYMYRIHIDEAYKLPAYPKWQEKDCPWGLPTGDGGSGFQMSFQCHLWGCIFKRINSGVRGDRMGRRVRRRTRYRSV